MKAWELLQQKEFCKGVGARNSDGHSVNPHSENAVAFCAIGAIARCYVTNVEIDSAIKKLRNHLGTLWIANWSDEKFREKEDVIAVLKELDL